MILKPSFLLSDIDRSIYETIRLSAVTAGLLVDIESYTGNQSGYISAQASLRASLQATGVNLLDLCGVGSGKARGERTNSKIIIDRKAVSPTNFGGGTVRYQAYTVSNVEKYKKVRYPEVASNVSYTIRTVALDSKNDRILSDLLYKSLKQSYYMKAWNSDSGQFSDAGFLLVYNGDVYLEGDSGIERVFNYTVNEVFIGSDDVIATNIPKMTSVTMNVKGLDNSGDLDNPTFTEEVTIEE